MIYETEALDLGITVVQHPARTLYKVWEAMIDWYGHSAMIGDRVNVCRSADFDEDGGLELHNLRHHHTLYMRLWPDGTFMLDHKIYDMYEFWRRHTFLSAGSYAAGKRVLMVKPMEFEGDRRYRYYEPLDERDWRAAKPYLDPYDLDHSVRFRLLYDGTWWRIGVDPRFPSEKAEKNLSEGYAFAQARYDRWQKRAANKDKNRTSNPLAIRTPTGHVTGDAAVAMMVKHLYVRTPEAQEAR